MNKKQIIVLGAGLAGLSTAWHLQRKGIECSVFEKEAQVGGLCRSKTIGGFTFDYDGHLLHFKHEYAFNLINTLLKDNFIEHRRNAFVYFHNKYIRYPFQVNLHDLPVPVARECLLGFIRTFKNGQRKDKKELNFLDWVNQTFGRGIAKYFMIPYNAKFWNISLKELTCEWLDGFIPVPSLSQIVEGTVEESRRQFGYNARFWYPRNGGINQLPLALAAAIKNIHTGSQVTAIDMVKKEIRLSSGGREKYDYLIFTAPLPEIVSLTGTLPKDISKLFKKLKWNSIFNLNLGLERKDGPTDKRHWVYFSQKEFSFFRVGFPHNFSPALVPAGKASLYAEVSYSQNRPINKRKITPLIIKDLKAAGIIGKRDKVLISEGNDIKYGYPIYDMHYSGIREKIIEYLTLKNIIPCGRYGSWRYMSMEDVILEGKNIADLF